MKRKPIGVVLATLVLMLAFSLGVGAQGKKTTPSAPGQKTELIDLNSATKEQLMTLTGIGDVLAQKIIDNRPYRAKNELVQKKIIPQATYNKISSQIIAKQSTGGAKKAPAKGTKGQY
jgi:DNA uptake protein ComE-like DNA-binding protein